MHRNFCFYKFANLERWYPGLRTTLLGQWTDLGVKGRVYLCKGEGINGNVSVPSVHMERFEDTLRPVLGDGLPYWNDGVDGGDHVRPFSSLHVRWRPSLVSVGPKWEPPLEDLLRGQGGDTICTTSLSAAQWNAALADEDAVLIDARNDYEQLVGRMEGCRSVAGVGAKTFREQVDQVVQELSNDKQRPVLMFCTSGIRCSKLSVVLERLGFTNISMLDGGVTKYARDARSQGLPIQFKGRLFSFDEVLQQKVTEDVISSCILCNAATPRQLNCSNVACHRLIVLCDKCHANLHGCCSATCLSDMNKRHHQQPLASNFS